ncbi:MAG: hypothetical protein JEZ14_01835 [Marinilabiliaceae bacterium]|nr:hypothetical protein [Marinilabiliaceae bacterium]
MRYLSSLVLVLFCACLQAQNFKSITDFGVNAKNDAATNKVALQKAIDWASTFGGALFVDPSEEPYKIDGGLILKANVSLIGVHAATPRGTKHPAKREPVGSVFSITDTKNPFLTVRSSTQIKGIQFYYPDQTVNDPNKIIKYPASIQVDKQTMTQGVLLSCLTFYGEYLAMDFNADRNMPSELITIEHCYGYPYGGEFIRFDYCYDIPRILNCHVNPGVMRGFKGQVHRDVVDAVIAKKTFTYSINHTDNAQLIDVFTFGVYGGIYLGPESYGQLTNFNLDCVTVGIYKLGANTKNRNWMIAQGSIIANTGPDLEAIHPIIIEGEGHTAISNLEAFSGPNPALTTIKEGQSYDYMLVKGNRRLTVTVMGCRMRNYHSENPLTKKNPQASIQFVGCVDKEEKFYNKTF